MIEEIQFQSTHPLRGATALGRVADPDQIDFNPRTPCGVRLILTNIDGLTSQFQSTHPLRGATHLLIIADAGFKFQSTHPLRGATILSSSMPRAFRFQSTHPLRGATYNGWTACAGQRFQSTHPLRGATETRLTVLRSLVFQSTHPLRGATRFNVLVGKQVGKFQSTHPLRGATWREYGGGRMDDISIHAPLAGCDSTARADHPLNRDFNPRTPCGVRHGGGVFVFTLGVISIHAPLAGCDRHSTVFCRSIFLYFNPRTPCGVRQQKRTKKTALFLN